MTAIGIIAEYNPFHCGHLYHLEQTREMLPNKPIIAVMSGHFLQRGEPALLNKWSRAEMALAQGVDLVLELPVLYSCRSAYWFARGSLEILKATKVVSHFSFGTEDGDLEALAETASVLVKEGDKLKEYLQQYLKRGLSYPRARAEALKLIPTLKKDSWSKPNNVLALTYLQVNEELRLGLTPLAIKRLGSGYHEKSLKSNQLPSATAIRNILTSNQTGNFLQSLAEIAQYLPTSTKDILAREYRLGRCPIELESMAPQVLTLLRRSSADDLRQIIEVSEGLENRLLDAASTATTLTEFLTKIKTKRFTYTRLQRFLVHLLLNYNNKQGDFLQEGPAYLRVLAFNNTGQQLLKEIKANTDLPIITQGKQSRKLTVNPHFEAFWRMDTLATDLYSLLYPKQVVRTGGDDYLRSPCKDI